MSLRKIHQDNIFAQMKDNPIVQKKGKTYVKIDKIIIKQIANGTLEITYEYRNKPIYSEQVLGCRFECGDTMTIADLKAKIQLSLI